MMSPSGMRGVVRVFAGLMLLAFGGLRAGAAERPMTGVFAQAGTAAQMPAPGGMRIGPSLTVRAISLITDATPGDPVRYGLQKFRAALVRQQYLVDDVKSIDQARVPTVIVAGLAKGTGLAATLIRDWKLAAPDAPEALLIRRLDRGGKKVLLVAGADGRGLMYALLDVAARIGWDTTGADPLAHVRETAESPDLAERGVVKYAFNKACFENDFFNESYWVRYFDTLAANRYNAFTLVFGYENGGYMAPPYPYFFDTPGFPAPMAIGVDEGYQKRYTETLHRVIALAHERGLSFTLGIWDHIAPKIDKPISGLPWGVNEKNLIPYTKAALGKFLDTFPEIDACQFRMHEESGLTRAQMDPFWEAVYGVWMKHAPRKRFEIRAKGVPDGLINKALARGIKLRLDTKVWCEQLGLPYHPTHINRQNQFDRRHSYADMLHYPRRYDVHWTLWNCGTTRALLWGDPEYARRLASAAHLGDVDNLTVNEPLATKMQSAPPGAPVFELLTKPYQYTDYEFERYWHLFQVFGRIGYNPNTPSDVFDHEFQVRFGSAARWVEQGLHSASWILPWLNACQLIGFPTTAAWPEKEAGFGLDKYSTLEPSDIEQFASIDEEARLSVMGGETVKILPTQSAARLEQTAREVLADIKQAEQSAGTKPGKELASTLVDLRILANLAHFHARRLPAAVAYRIFKLSGDVNALDKAIVGEKNAIAAWEEILKAASGVYNENMVFGRMGGHWRDELKVLQDDLRSLEQERLTFDPGAGEVSAMTLSPRILHAPARWARPGSPLVLSATVVPSSLPVREVTLFYGCVGQAWKSIPMEPAALHQYLATIPAAEVTGDLAYIIAANSGPEYQAAWPPEGMRRPQFVRVTADAAPPMVAFTPVTRAAGWQPLPITVRATDPSGVKAVRLRYRSVNQMFDYKTLAMEPTGQPGIYQAVIPASELDPQWDFQYFIEALDAKGNGKIYPAIEQGAPYVVAQLVRPQTAKASPPPLASTAVKSQSSARKTGGTKAKTSTTSGKARPSARKATKAKTTTQPPTTVAPR